MCLLVSFTASQGQDKSRHFPVLLCISFFSPRLQQMVKGKSLSAGGRMHQGQGLSFEVHSEPGWFDKTILHTLSLIKYMRKKRAGFAKQLDTKTLISLGILQNSMLEWHSRVWQQTHIETWRNKERLTKRLVDQTERRMGGWDGEGVNIDIPEHLILLQLQTITE